MFPAFGAATPVQNLRYGIGLGISTSGFNQLLRSQIEGGLLRSTLSEIDLGSGPIPLNAGLLAALFTPFSQLPPATPIAIRISPTLAPVLTGAVGPAGELGELRISSSSCSRRCWCRTRRTRAAATTARAGSCRR